MKKKDFVKIVNEESERLFPQILKFYENNIKSNELPIAACVLHRISCMLIAISYMHAKEISKDETFLERLHEQTNDLILDSYSQMKKHNEKETIN